MTCPHGSRSGSELASKLQVGYSSNMHEASLSAGAAPPQVRPGPQALVPPPIWQCVAMWWAAHAWAAPEYRRRWCCHICSCMPQCSAPICHYAMQAFGCSTAPLHHCEGWVKNKWMGVKPQSLQLHCPGVSPYMAGCISPCRSSHPKKAHPQGATACCFLFTRTTPARVAGERTPLGRGTRPAAHWLLHP